MQNSERSSKQFMLKYLGKNLISIPNMLAYTMKLETANSNGIDAKTK